ncbi:DMT family transporter [Rhizorhabdus dicambivorans]|uniref:EamA/RhaT family transporter n=1 Tax=Rhizorhabdus dicambivorans TaxID=1850238 RepID=A0A2A4FYV6_9SPHN|nr:DMT family transporter [Rhizorhabdus dicambivorans]ATE67133.1 EamA/RhaT family transporter [Rhizorhabdus dicambivorans]PCE42915.1 EamA/RhaT family transporter [Rhizorhabdus dicambivorans]
MSKQPRSSVLAAFAVACLGIALFSSMDAVVKHLSLAIGTYNTLLWRSFAGIGVSAVPWLWSRPVRPSRPAMRLHIERGVVSAVMAMLFFWGLARTPMAQAIALTFIAPLIAQGLAVVLLKERMKRGALVGSALGFGGVLVILWGQASANMGPDAWWGAVAVLLSAMCYAYNIILMRRQAQIADPYEVAFFQSVIVALCLAFAMPWFAELPPARHVPMILLGALLATASLALLGWAYARAEASYLAPVEFTAFIWASLWGFLFFGEHVGLTTLLGATLIVAGCLIAARPPDLERDVIP